MVASFPMENGPQTANAVRIQHEKALKFVVNTDPIKLVTKYLRVLGHSAYKQALQSSGDELLVLVGKLQLIQKLLDVLSSEDDSSLVPYKER